MHKIHGRLLPVGGHVELDETPWQAAAHEIAEESGYKLAQLKVLQPRKRIASLPKVKLHPYPVVLNTHEITSTHFHSDTAYGFVATSEPIGKIDADESTDLRWLTLSEINALDESEMYLNTKAVCEFIFEVCLQAWEQVDATCFDL